MVPWLMYPDFLAVCFFLVAAVMVVVGAILSEAAGPLTRWLQARSGYGDPRQTAAVRAYSLKLASRKRKVRMAAVERLGDLNDRSAVPALVKLIEKHRTDGPLLERAVRVLAKLGDERALPALRQLSHGRHQSLMAEARAAVSAIEPRSVLLRASTGPAAGDGNHLLRAAGTRGSSDPELLLRPSSD